MTPAEAVKLIGKMERGSILNSEFSSALAVLTALAEENSALKAEVANYRILYQDEILITKEQKETMDGLWIRINKAEAEVERARPLLEAVEKWDGETILWDDIGKVALAYRKAKEKK